MELTPAQKIRLQLEKQMAQDAIARAQKIKREATAILPTFMGENGKVKRLGHGEQRVAIAPNLQYLNGEEMRPIPVRGGLPLVDNKSRLPGPVLPTAVDPPTPPLNKRFQITFEISTDLYMYTGFASTLGSPDASAPIPYNENGFFIPETYEINKGIFLPAGTSLGDNIEIAPGVFNPIDFGTTSIYETDPYFADPYQFFGIVLNCEKNYRLELQAYLYQESPAEDNFFYSNSVLSETWMAIGDITGLESFSLIYTHTHSSITQSGGGGAANLMPTIYIAGASGETLECDNPEGITYTFFIRFKQVSKSNWFEL